MVSDVKERADVVDEKRAAVERRMVLSVDFILMTGIEDLQQVDGDRAGEMAQG